MMNKPKHHLHGKVIKFEEMVELFPERIDFLDGTEEITNRINIGKSLRFMPNDVMEQTVREKHGQSSDDDYAPGYYRIFIAGTLADGRKAIVMIENVLPHFYVKVPKDSTIDKVKSDISFICERNRAQYEGRLKSVYKKEFKYNSSAHFIKVSFRTLNKRNNALFHINRQDLYETVHNDSKRSTRSDYYHIVARDYGKTLSSWVVIRNYSYIEYNLCYMKIFKVDVNDYTTFQGSLDYESSRDKLIELDWDCETDSAYPTGDVPQPYIKTDELFMIGISIQHHDTAINTNILGDRITDELDGELLNVVLVNVDCDPYSNKLTIVCDTEPNIIRAFAIIFKKIKPDFVCGFNDSDYDWKWFVYRALQHGLIRFIERRMSLIEVLDMKNKNLKNIDNYKHYVPDTIKLEAGNINISSQSLKYFGYICIDVRTQFRIIHKQSVRSSLKYFLEINNLGSKADMEYIRMAKIYKTAKKLKESRETKEIKEADDEEIIQSKKDMAEVAEYCYIDALRCHELLKRRDLFRVKAAFATLTYTTIWSGFFHADGVKIKNLLIHQAQIMGYLISGLGSGDPPRSYPGAYVGFPEKGLIATKLSIDERIGIAKEEISKDSDSKIDEIIYNIELDNQRPHILWKYVSLENIKLMYQFIEKWGPAYNETSSKTFDVVNALIQNLDSQWNNEQSTELPKDHIEKLHTTTQILARYNIMCRSPASVCFMQFITEENKYPVCSFDFKSLYPNTIRTFNLSHEYVIKDKTVAQQAIADGCKLQEINFTHKGYTHIAWIPQHDNDLDKMGIIPLVINDLQNRRDIQKLPKTAYEHALEHMASNSIRKMLLGELIQMTYDHVNNKRPEGKKVSMRNIITKHLGIDINAVKKNGRV